MADPKKTLAEQIEEIMDNRERKQAEAKDPKKRFDSLMGRLEGFLDAQEGKKKPKEGEKSEDDGAGFFDALMGGKS